MKLRRLRLESFKRFRQPLVIEGFTEGINLFAAPNEAGKSTIAEAIRAAFFERHRSSSVEHLRPWDEPSSTPTVELQFELDGKQHRLTKAFLSRKRCDLSIDGASLDGAAAEDYLAERLGFKFPGKGASAPEHMGIPGLLWIRQGTSHELADPVSHAANHLQNSLGESLGDLAASGGDALLQAVETARHELLTPAGGNPRGAYQEALERKKELGNAITGLSADILAYQDSVDRLAALRRDHLRDERERPWEAIRAQHTEARARLQSAEGLEARQATERDSLGQWTAQVSALQSRLDAFDREAAAVVTRTQALQKAASDAAAAQADVTVKDGRHREAVQAHAQARALSERVSAVAARAEKNQAAADLEAALQSAGLTLASAREERARLGRLQAEAAGFAVAADDLAQLKTLSASLRDVTVRLEAVATSIEFDLLDGREVSMAAEPLSGQARRTVVSRTEIAIAGVGRITVVPGGPDLDALADTRTTLAAQISALLARLGVASLADAEERDRRSAQCLQQARESQKLLAALAPEGVEALEAALAVRSKRLTELRAVLGALPPSAADDATLPDMAQALGAEAQARQVLESAMASLNDTRVALASAQAAQTSAAQELAAAQATVNDPQRIAQEPVVRQQLAAAQVQVIAAQQRVDDIGAELKSVNLALLRQDVERLDRSAAQLEDAHQKRRDQINRLEVELETNGARGLEEARADAQRELEQVSRRVDELARRAAALSHLLSLLRDKRAALARRLRAPLQRHLDRYLQILFPGAQIEVADDLSPGAMTRIGPLGAERGSFEDLSLGAREQMGIIARLAYADLLQEAGRPTLLMLDDALVHTDEDRLGQMKRVLYDAASRHQMLIFTCHPAAWRDLGVPVRSLGGG